jgi:hypothetical protein
MGVFAEGDRLLGLPGRQMSKLSCSVKAAVKAAMTESLAVRESRWVLSSSAAKRSQYAVMRVEESRRCWWKVIGRKRRCAFFMCVMGVARGPGRVEAATPGS